MKKNAPCFPECSDRASGCHAQCQRYKEWRAEMDVIKAHIDSEKAKKRDYNEYLEKVIDRRSKKKPF